MLWTKHCGSVTKFLESGLPGPHFIVITFIHFKYRSVHLLLFAFALTPLLPFPCRLYFFSTLLIFEYVTHRQGSNNQVCKKGIFTTGSLSANTIPNSFYPSRSIPTHTLWVTNLNLWVFFPVFLRVSYTKGSIIQ